MPGLGDCLIDRDFLMNAISQGRNRLSASLSSGRSDRRANI